jgi:hypothetical protein
MSRSITINYDLHPPPSPSHPSALEALPTSAHPSDLTRTKTLEIPVKLEAAPAAEGRVKSYYESLRGAIGEAKTTLGRDLTAWREAVGSGEQFKESKRVVKVDDDEVLDGDDEDSE